MGNLLGVSGSESRAMCRFCFDVVWCDFGDGRLDGIGTKLKLLIKSVNVFT